MDFDPKDLRFFWLLLVGFSTLLLIALTYIWKTQIYPSDRDPDESITSTYLRFAKRHPVQGGITLFLYLILLVSTISLL